MDLDALTVQSFATSALAVDGRGTVRGQDAGGTPSLLQRTFCICTITITVVDPELTNAGN